MNYEFKTKLESIGGVNNVIVYINKNDVEFAKEFDNINDDEKNQLIQYIKSRYPKIKINLIKVMIGGLLITSVPFVGTAFSGAAFASANYNKYTVKSGDTLWTISRKFNVSINDIKIANNLTSNVIHPNQILNIPTTTETNTYIVKSGDTLWKIANQFNTSISAIKSKNSLTSDLIQPGQKLLLPSTSQEAISTYTVKSGDTLWVIAKNNNMSVSKLKSINNLTSDLITPGQKLKVTGSTIEYTKPTITYTTHYVKSGENAWSISIDYGIPSRELLEANGLSSSSVLKIGQQLKIPVHNIPVKPTVGPQYGEYLDWWSEAQYVFATNDVATVTDFNTGKTFKIKRTTGANHADCEPLTASDAAIAKDIWGGYSWKTRPVLIHVNGHKIAGSMSYMPHDVQYINNNNFNGHFDIHFLNSTRHKDGKIDTYHQNSIKEAAGINKI